SALSAALLSSFGGVAFCASSAASRILVNASFMSAALSVFCTTFRFSLRMSMLSSRSAANADEPRTSVEAATIANRCLRIAHFLFLLLITLLRGLLPGDFHLRQ